MAALDFRKHWRPGQAEVVLKLALRAEEPAVRAAALSALANLEDRLRTPFVLCDVEGISNEEAARALGWLLPDGPGDSLETLLELRPKEREAMVRRALRSTRAAGPELLRGWRAWALGGRRK